MSNVRVFVVAPDPLARAGLAQLLSEQPGCSLAGQAGAGIDLLAEVAAAGAEIVVWDLGWDPGVALRSQLEHLSELGAAGVPALVLMPDPSYATTIWSAGIRGLLLRDASADRIFAALSALRNGLAVLDPALGEAAFGGLAAPPHPLDETLTPREIEVLKLLSSGRTNRGIATRLDISENTVKFHVNSILRKLNAQSRTEAVTLAARLGIIPL